MSRSNGPVTRGESHHQDWPYPADSNLPGQTPSHQPAHWPPIFPQHHSHPAAHPQHAEPDHQTSGYHYPQHQARGYIRSRINTVRTDIRPSRERPNRHFQPRAGTRRFSVINHRSTAQAIISRAPMLPASRIIFALLVASSRPIATIRSFRGFKLLVSRGGLIQPCAISCSRCKATDGSSPILSPAPRRAIPIRGTMISAAICRQRKRSRRDTGKASCPTIIITSSPTGRTSTTIGTDTITKAGRAAGRRIITPKSAMRHCLLSIVRSLETLIPRSSTTTNTESRRSRRGLLITGALVGAIIAGEDWLTGTIIIGPTASGTPPVIKADSRPAKSQPEDQVAASLRIPTAS